MTPGHVLLFVYKINWGLTCNAINNLSPSEGSDYQPVIDQQLTFSPSQTEKTFPITINDDVVLEPTENFTVQLSLNQTGVSSVMIQSETAVVNIIDNDNLGKTSAYMYSYKLNFNLWPSIHNRM